MRYLLDTNVISEATKPRPDPAVARWLEVTPLVDLAISVLTLGEIRAGLELMAEGTRREVLVRWLEEDVPRQFVHRVLSIDAETSTEWGRLSAEGRRAGRELPVIDGLLLSTAAVHGLTFVTQNERDCAGRGVPILNPWTG
jgi:predicted nucleic acid-binding protein